MLRDANSHRSVNQRPAEMLRPQVTLRWTAVQQTDVPSDT